MDMNTLDRFAQHNAMIESEEQRQKWETWKQGFNLCFNDSMGTKINWYEVFQQEGFEMGGSVANYWVSVKGGMFGWSKTFTVGFYSPKPRDLVVKMLHRHMSYVERTRTSLEVHKVWDRVNVLWEEVQRCS